MLASWPRTKGSIARRLQLVSPPTVEPISAAIESTAFKVAVNTNAFDIQQRIASARTLVEKKINRKLVTQVWDMFLDDEAYVSQDSGIFGLGLCDAMYSDVNIGMPEIVLPFPPVRSVLGVYVTDPYGDEQQVDDSVYFVTTAREPTRIRLRPGQVWPFHRGAEAFRVRFACGYAAPFKVSDDQMTILCPNHGYQDGNTVSFSSTDGTLPAPLDWGASYLVDAGSTPNSFSLVNLDGSPLSDALDNTWPGIGFVDEIPAPLLVAVTMVSALERGGSIPPRILAGEAKMESLSLPINPFELIEDYIWPAL